MPGHLAGINLSKQTARSFIPHCFPRLPISILTLHLTRQNLQSFVLIRRVIYFQVELLTIAILVEALYTGKIIHEASDHQPQSEQYSIVTRLKPQLLPREHTAGRLNSSLRYK